MTKNRIEGERINQRETLWVATDATWHHVVANILNQEIPGTVKTLPENAQGHQGFTYPVESPFTTLTRAAGNTDVSLKDAIPDETSRRAAVERVVGSAYKDTFAKKQRVA